MTEKTDQHNDELLSVPPARLGIHTLHQALLDGADWCRDKTEFRLPGAVDVGRVRDALYQTSLGDLMAAPGETLTPHRRFYTDPGPLPQIRVGTDPLTLISYGSWGSRHKALGLEGWAGKVHVTFWYSTPAGLMGERICLRDHFVPAYQPTFAADFVLQTPHVVVFPRIERQAGGSAEADTLLATITSLHATD